MQGMGRYRMSTKNGIDSYGGIRCKMLRVTIRLTYERDLKVTPRVRATIATKMHMAVIMRPTTIPFSGDIPM